MGKPLFGLFMGARLAKKTAEIAEDEERIFTIVHTLCRLCTGTPAARVLNKFTENNFEELYEQYRTKLQSKHQSDTAKEVLAEVGLTEELGEEQEFLQRCEQGLFTLQQVDFTLVRLANMGNKRMSAAVAATMKTKGVPY